MKNRNYMGNILNMLPEVLGKKDGFSAGEKLTEIQKLAKKKFYEMTDQEVYQAMEDYLATPLEDAPYETEEDFVAWVEVIFDNGDRLPTFGIARHV